MKKIMFNDKYGLTEAVLQGRKTMTRRIINLTDTDKEYLDTAFDWDLRERVIIDRYAKYKVGEIVAVAQSYNNAGKEAEFETHDEALAIILLGKQREKGWSNKMFVSADLMPHQIRITDIKVERLQDISDEDCLKEGIWRREIMPFKTIEIKYQVPYTVIYKDNPRAAFASLINKVSGKGTWQRNPFVFAYEFELVK